MKTVETFSNENPKFRKAYIRERLAALKLEQEALKAERAEIDRESEVDVAQRSALAERTGRS